MPRPSRGRIADMPMILGQLRRERNEWPTALVI
jgi:hypothetical protein